MVAVADRPLVGGTTFDVDAIRLVPVDADFEGLDALVSEEGLSSYDGWVVSSAVPRGTPLRVVDLVPPGAVSGLRSMSLPVPIEHAAGGSIDRGDLIDVISVTEAGARYVATALEVISVSEASTGSIGATGGYHVVVAVEATEALRLAEALESGSIELIRSTGAVEIGGSGIGSGE